MPDRVDAVMDEPQPPLGDPALDRAPADPAVEQLPARNRAMLAIGQRRNREI